jgi:hypothetical protein
MTTRCIRIALESSIRTLRKFERLFLLSSQLTEN